MEIVTPALAAALHELQVLDPRQRPMLAAHWVAQGLGGPVVAELAGLRGDEREVSDLWPPAMEELGVPVPVTGARRTALAWVARRVVSGAEDLDWLLWALWPTRRDDTDDDELMDRVVYAIDEILDHVGAVDEAGRRGGWLGRRRARKDREHTDRLRSRVKAALEAMSRSDLDAAAVALKTRSSTA